MSTRFSQTDSNTGELSSGVVIKKAPGLYSVLIEGRTVLCTLSPHLSKPPAKAQSMPGEVVVGDVVRVSALAGGGAWISAVLPRRTRLSRRSPVPMPGAHASEQVIVANIDQVVPVFAAANPTPAWNMLDRYLASAESLDLPALICVTKLDLAQEEDGSMDTALQAVADEYRRIGYPVLFTSAKTGAGQAELAQALQGRVSVLVGKSGVGKTSLLDGLQPGLGRAVQAVNPVTGKGRHTTSSAEMIPLADGGAIIDTPGVREFGLWDLAAEDLALYFPEMRPLVGRCKFGLDCRHDEEPGCAIRKAVTAGQISPRRYQSYLRLQEEGYFH